MTKVPFKNYLYLLLVIIVSIFIVDYLYLWFLEYNNNADNKSILVESMQIINKNEIDNYLVENKDAVIYVSVSNDKKIKKFEKKLNKLINDKNINNKILYLDLTSDKSNNIYGINDKVIKVPSFIVYKNGKFVEDYDVGKNNYEINKVENYLSDIGVVRND